MTGGMAMRIARPKAIIARLLALVFAFGAPTALASCTPEALPIRNACLSS